VPGAGVAVPGPLSPGALHQRSAARRARAPAAGSWAPSTADWAATPPQVPIPRVRSAVIPPRAKAGTGKRAARARKPSTPSGGLRAGGEHRGDEDAVRPRGGEQLLLRVHRGAEPPVGAEEGTDLGGPGPFDREMEVGAEDPGHVWPPIDAQLGSAPLAEDGQALAPGEEGAHLSAGVAVLDRHLRAERGDRLQRRPVRGLGQRPVGHHDEAGQPQSTSPSMGLEAEP